MNLGNFRSRVSGVLGLDSATGSDEEERIDGWVNEGVVDVLMRTHCFVDEDTFTTTSGTDDYHESVNILALEHVTMPYQSQNYVLPRKTPSEIMLLRQGNASTATGQPWVYALRGGDTFMFYPPPTGQAVTYWFVPKPVILTDTSHDPSEETYGGIASQYHPAIEYYALWRAAEYDDHRFSQYGERFRVMYEGQRGNGGWIAKIRAAMYRKGGRDPGQFALPGRVGYLSPDPSYDYGR